jgi:hypothetical protein
MTFALSRAKTAATRVARSKSAVPRMTLVALSLGMMRS